MTKHADDLPTTKLDLIEGELLNGAFRTNAARRDVLVSALCGRIESEAVWMPRAVELALPALQALVGNFFEFRRQMQLAQVLFGGIHMAAAGADVDVPAGMLKRVAEELSEV